MNMNVVPGQSGAWNNAHPFIFTGTILVFVTLPEHRATRRILGPPPTQAGLEQVAATAMEYHSKPGYVLLSACYVDDKGGKHYDNHQYEIVFATPEPEMIDLDRLTPAYNACPHCKPAPSPLVHVSYYCSVCNRSVCVKCEYHQHPVGPPEMRDEWTREQKRLGMD